MLTSQDDPRHGTVNGYGNHRCRCDRCKAAMSAHARETYAVRQLDVCACGKPKRTVASHCRECYNLLREADHGTEARYTRCHCDECKRAARVGRRRRRQAQETV